MTSPVVSGGSASSPAPVGGRGIESVEEEEAAEARAEEDVEEEVLFFDLVILYSRILSSFKLASR